MPKKSVSELEGAELDYWVALAEGLHPELENGETWIYKRSNSTDTITKVYSPTATDYHRTIAWNYSPSDNWDHGGQIIEKNGISLMHRLGKDGGCSSYYHAQVGPEEPENTTLMTHEKPLVAAMRSFVASKFGEYVEIP